ncbi:hypothetical protein [Streptomyces odontomachi]|uniref:hypothetical protein n=1 Tax=Streptomyces odontomachi TaxID=2944940 RepID=UPI002108863F|nr:hypothetical protein [Streptomyces sp. ODS25]
MITERARTAHHSSADGLARRALGVLADAEGTAPVAAAHLAEAADRSEGDLAVALGAVRMLGADVLAPCLLAGHAAPPDEVTAVGLALAALPPADPPPPAPPEGSEQAWVRAWLDWGLVTALSRTGAECTAKAPLPPGPPLCDDDADHGHPPTTHAHPREGWLPWSERMGQLSSLALPGLDSAVHDAARAGVLGLARGATRAMLRRDFPTAGRIARWLAWLGAEGAVLPLDLVPLTARLGLLGGGERLALDVAIARRLLDLEHE